MMRYNPSEIEPKWQKTWADDARYQAKDFDKKPKYYVTGMFPYPSGAGMHTGHFFEHSIVDAEARFRRALGYNVMYPMGFDNFGLPAENYAIKTGISPQQATRENIANFKNQLTRVGASIDWSREVQTSDPSYYKWTQWVFTKLFERGLAYQKESLQWWCEIDQTVLANEQVVNGKCWRHDGPNDPPAVKKSFKQWFFKITDYADELLEEIPALDWPEKIKAAQTNWIGKSEGAEIEFVVASSPAKLSKTASRRNSDGAPASAESRAADVSESLSASGPKPTITVFSTRPDTIFGATYLVLAPEHPLARTLATDDTREAVGAYIDEAIKKSEIDRQAEGKEKTGVFTGSYAINPGNGAKVQIWIADYVLGGYGTGAIMAVPAHDERDLEFAEKFGLPVVQVVAPYVIGDGRHTPRDDVETLNRPVVDAIITDGNGKYLLEIEDEYNIHFVGGGVDDTDKTTEDALRREIIEEVGFTNIISIKQASPFDSGFYYRDTKNRNQKVWGAFFEVVVDPLVQVESEIDQGKHTIEWVDRSEVAGRLTWDSCKKAWQAYLEGRTTDTEVREGLLVNSGPFDGMPSSEAREQITDWLERQGTGRHKTSYKMRDWLISRQRYWGAPIPIVHCDEHGAVSVPEKDLPVVLPDVEDFAPKGDGKSPLARVDEWVNTTCPICGRAAKRETDVMDGYACSSWYLLRYTDPSDSEQAWNPELADYWTPLDMYVGGDHAVAHLLYVRFWNHVFYDMGLVPTKEPVKKLVYHGYINAEDGTKMSKSKGNVVDPLEVIDAGYGADALRTFELFLGPINENSNWSSTGIAGVYRFLNRLWTIVQEYEEATASSPSEFSKTAKRRVPSGALAPVETRVADVSENSTASGSTGLTRKFESVTHQTIKKVTDDIRRLSFNTAIAAQMEFVNDLYKLKTSGFSEEWQSVLEVAVRLVQPFAPHMAAELWQQLGHDSQLDFEPWPEWDESKIISDDMTIVVQVNGKVRAQLTLPRDASEDDIKAEALAADNVVKFIGDKKPAKVIYIPGRLVNIVVK
jgi:leucyl-tRNA synthetase